MNYIIGILVYSLICLFATNYLLGGSWVSKKGKQTSFLFPLFALISLMLLYLFIL